MKNLNVVVRLENVMMNGFNVEESYERNLRKRVNLVKEMNEGVEDILCELNDLNKKKMELMEEIDGMSEEIRGFMNEKRLLKMNDELSKQEKEVEKERINDKIEELREVKKRKVEEKKRMNDRMKEIRKEREEVKEEIRRDMEEDMNELRNREKEMELKRLKEGFDEDFENKKLRKGVKEIFDRLFKLMNYNKEVGFKVYVVSDVRSLKVRRLLKNEGLEDCEVLNSSVEGWRRNLEKEGNEVIFVESKEDLGGLVEKVKLVLK